MQEAKISLAVHEIDEQLDLLVNKKVPINQLKVLLELRNNIILKYKPSPNVDWTIQSKNVLTFLEKENWHVHWVSVDVPI